MYYITLCSHLALLFACSTRRRKKKKKKRKRTRPSKKEQETEQEQKKKNKDRHGKLEERRQKKKKKKKKKKHTQCISKNKSKVDREGMIHKFKREKEVKDIGLNSTNYKQEAQSCVVCFLLFFSAFAQRVRLVL